MSIPEVRDFRSGRGLTQFWRRKGGAHVSPQWDCDLWIIFCRCPQTLSFLDTFLLVPPTETELHKSTTYQDLPETQLPQCSVWLLRKWTVKPEGNGQGVWTGDVPRGNSKPITFFFLYPFCECSMDIPSICHSCTGFMQPSSCAWNCSLCFWWRSNMFSLDRSTGWRFTARLSPGHHCAWSNHAVPLRSMVVPSTLETCERIRPSSSSRCTESWKLDLFVCLIHYIRKTYIHEHLRK